MLLKKRIFVFAPRVAELMAIVRTFPLLVIAMSLFASWINAQFLLIQGAWHRLDWDILRPFVTLDAVELEDLRAAGVYVAGITDPSASSKKDLFDLYVDGKLLRVRYSFLHLCSLALCMCSL